MDYIYKYSVL